MIKSRQCKQYQALQEGIVQSIQPLRPEQSFLPQQKNFSYFSELTFEDLKNKMVIT
jgi:hypothetical protein